MPALTDDEREEVRQLARRSRAGRQRPGDQERIFELYAKDPDGYGEAAKLGRKDADGEVNPFG